MEVSDLDVGLICGAIIGGLAALITVWVVKGICICTSLKGV